MDTEAGYKPLPSPDKPNNQPNNTSLLAHLDFMSQEPSEQSRREALMHRYVEQHVLPVDPNFEFEDLNEVYAALSTREKTDLLYQKLMAHRQALKEIQGEEREDPESTPEPIDPYLLSEISTLWSDPKVQHMAAERYSEARDDIHVYRLSEQGQKWERINQTIEERRQAFQQNTQDLFLRRVTRPDRVEATRSRTQRLAQELISLRKQREDILKLNNLLHTPENTDVAAIINYERLVEMHSQHEADGFVWLESREELYQKTVQGLQNGRWPLLVGEAGTGKSELADAAALTLTGEQPTHVACSERTSVRDLVSDKEIDPVTGGSYDAYKPVMEAATGYDDSRQTAPSHETGRIVRFDESGRLGSQGYALIKELRQKRPGDQLEGKPVLPGFASIWTTNPVGPRYPDRQEPDPALRRELATIPVDYPPMTHDNPEVYEFMLATLMDHNNHIAIARNELAPAYAKNQDAVPEKLPDGRTGIQDKKLIEQSNDPRHGVAYRLSFAIRAVQDAFIYGNADTIPSSALRFKTNPNGTVEVDQTANGELLTLATSTITLGELASWMTGFKERTQKDNPDFQTENFTEWVQNKINLYLDQTDAGDRDKIKAIFNHFHLLDPLTAQQKVELQTAVPLTPKDIGYLSPRIPQPYRIIDQAPVQEARPKVEHTQNQDRLLIFEDGSRENIIPGIFTFQQNGKEISLKNGSRFVLSGEKLRFIGQDSEGKLVVRIDTGRKDEALHRKIEESQLEQGDFRNIALERAQELFGEDFLGEEAIHLMEDKFKAIGVSVQFELPDIDTPYEEDYIETAKEDEKQGKARLFVRRPEFMTLNGVRQPITLLSLRQLFKSTTGTSLNPFGTGAIFYDQDWHDSEPFAKAQMKGGFAMPTKEVIPGSTNKTWNQQQALLGADERRREAVETAWDLMLYHSTTSKKILEDKYDWGNALSSGGHRVCVGGFSEDGFDVDGNRPSDSDDVLGVCSSK